MTGAGGQAGIPSDAGAVISDAEALARTETAARLTLTEATVLATTARNGPVGLSWLAREEGMNPTMLSRVVWRLEDAGLLARRPDPRDRRAALVDATLAGGGCTTG